MSKPAKSSGAKPAAPDPFVLCAQKPQKPVVVPAGLNPIRASAIRIGAKKWVNGTVLHYYFLDINPGGQWQADQKAVVVGAMARWTGLGIGLSFTEVNDPSEAEIVIGCVQGDGSWSLVGTDNLDTSFRQDGRTLNYGWDLTTTWGGATALHELGHALGFSHEHQSPNAGIVWNQAAVYQYFSGPPNSWSKDMIDSNIIEKLDPSQVQGSAWDPKSIMEYPFQRGLISAPKPYDTTGVGENLDLSPDDITWMKAWYPQVNQAPAVINTMDLKHLDAAAGQQRDFQFTPSATRDYTISTVGASDCRVVVFEVRGGELRHLASQDDSGSESNIAIKQKLVKGDTYTIRIRVNFVSAPDGVGLLIV